MRSVRFGNGFGSLYGISETSKLSAEGNVGLGKLLKRAAAGEIYLYYYDEAAFSLELNVP